MKQEHNKAFNYHILIRYQDGKWKNVTAFYAVDILHDLIFLFFRAKLLLEINLLKQHFGFIVTIPLVFTPHRL